MTSLLSCILATVALGANADMHGLPFGIPPAPDDAVISHVAPPKCLFYVNWAGTASPNSAGKCETEKLLAEPEVQEFLGGLNRAFASYLHKADDEAKKAAVAFAVAVPTPPPPVPPNPAEVAPPISDPTSPPPPPATAAPSPTAPPPPTSSMIAQGHCESGPAGNCKPVGAKPTFSILAADYGDMLSVLITHPTAIFVSDIKLPPSDEKESNSAKKSDQPQPKPSAEDVKAAEIAIPPPPDIQGGMVVSLGPEAARWKDKFAAYLAKAKKIGADSSVETIKIDGTTWYRMKPTKPGEKNLATFGFHGTYLVVGIGEGTVESILARWNSPAPDWLNKALAETEVPRRTGIIYLNIKRLLKCMQWPSKLQDRMLCKYAGLDNVNSLVSTTGIEADGMVNRVLLACDGPPHGVLGMVIADRPLAAKDFEPIPSDALFAIAARADFECSFNALFAAYDMAIPKSDTEGHRRLQVIKDERTTVLLHRLFSALGDSLCVYNSPAEGEMAFMGWTAVLPLRDRAALIDSAEKLSALKITKGDKEQSPLSDDIRQLSDYARNLPQFKKCSFAGHEVYYLSGQVIAPAIYVSDREMVMTLSMPAMKAYLLRKEHRSLAALESVKAAMNDRNPPIALGYCDTPQVFSLIYPMFSLYAGMGASAADKIGVDLPPTFWPSAPAVRSYLSADITTLRRTPHGIELNCRYCLPTGGINGPLWLFAVASGAQSFAFMNFMPRVSSVIEPDNVPPAVDEKTQASPPSASGYANGIGVPLPGEAPSAVHSPAEPPYSPYPAPTCPTAPAPAQNPYAEPAVYPNAKSSNDAPAYKHPKGNAVSPPANSPAPKDTSLWDERDMRSPITGPMGTESPDPVMITPSTKEVLGRLRPAWTARDSSASPYTFERTNVRVNCEIIRDSIDPPRMMPLVGPVQVHHVLYKCTVRYCEKLLVDSPNANTKPDECNETIYLDHDHFHRVATTDDKSAPAKSEKTSK